MTATDPDDLKKNITAAQAVKILKENDLHISEKEAEKVLELLYFLGKLTVNQCVKDGS